MKITKRDFITFKDTFLNYQTMLDSQGYSVVFQQKELDGNFASIVINEEGRIVTVYLNTEVNGLDAECFSPAIHAKHEAIHLFLHRMVYLANERFINSQAVENEWERQVRVLERLL